MGLNYHASQPTLILPPQAPPSYLPGMTMDHSMTVHTPMRTGRRKSPVPPSLNYQASVSTSAAGRKRAIADVDTDEHSPDGAYAVQEPPKPKVEPIYGPGMTLIYPGDPRFNISAESQTGTWAEEREAREKAAKEAEAAVRPIAVSRKSARLDNSANTRKPAAQQSSASIIDQNGNTVDTLINALGIGWKNIMTSENLRDAARAYERVISRHFDLTEPTLMLEREAINAYLVRAKEMGVVKYWLFHDSLSWCQLVGNNLYEAVNNLSAGPVPLTIGARIEARQRSLSPAVQSIEQAVAVPASNEIPMADAMQM